MKILCQDRPNKTIKSNFRKFTVKKTQIPNIGFNYTIRTKNIAYSNKVMRSDTAANRTRQRDICRLQKTPICSHLAILFLQF